MTAFNPDGYLERLQRKLPHSTVRWHPYTRAEDIARVNAWYEGAGKAHRWQRGESFTYSAEPTDMKIYETN